MCYNLHDVKRANTIWMWFVDCNNPKIYDFDIFQNSRKYNILSGLGTYLTIWVHSEVRDNELCCFLCANPKQTLYGDITLNMVLFARFKNTKANSGLSFSG